MNRAKPGKKKQRGLLHTLCQRTTSTYSGILFITANNSYLKETDVKTKLHEDLWTNSLLLYPNKVVVKTYDHKNSVWIESLTREIKLSKVD